MSGENVKDPNLTNWELITFDEEKMVFLLNFLSPLSVSKGDQKDKVIIDILSPDIFIRKDSKIRMS